MVIYYTNFKIKIMEIVLSLAWLKWGSFIIAFLVWLQWEIREDRKDRGGYINGTHLIVTVPTLLIGIIIWLIIFFVFL